jgi:hypothetical protein
MKSSRNRRAPPGPRDSIILAQVAFGHATNKQGRGMLLSERGRSLVDAAYRSLGCRTDRHGRWQ